MKKLTLLLALLLGSSALMAQTVATTQLLQNSPYRHHYNPAWEPRTNGYVLVPIFPHLSLSMGSNAFALSNFLISQNGQTMTTLHPDAKVKPLDGVPRNILISTDMNITLLGFGWRTRHDGYVHVDLSQHLSGGIGLSRGLFSLLLDGGMKNPDGDNHFDLTGIGASVQSYTQLALGYSHRQSDIWTWGFNLKLLAGEAEVRLQNKQLGLDASIDRWRLKGDGSVRIALPMDDYPNTLDQEGINHYMDQSPFDNMMSDIRSMLHPAGYGFGLDLGAEVRPVEHLTVSLALTDVGTIYWKRGRSYRYHMDGTWDGMHGLNYSDFATEDGKLDTDLLTDSIISGLKNIYEDGFSTEAGKKHFWSPLTMKLNASVEGNFWENRIGVGLYSRTMLLNSKLYEELNVGAAFRPCTWWDIAVNYELLNGRFSNLGAGTSLRLGPIALTLSADYIPLNWASLHLDEDGKRSAHVPYKSTSFNIEMGLAFVWGWKSNRDSDKDGVKDRFDICPKTPQNVSVDILGCPLDSDDDGVPDYLDECPGTKVKEFGLTDEKGCPPSHDED